MPYRIMQAMRAGGTLLAFAAANAAGATALGDGELDPAAYPELAPEKLLPVIIADLKRTIADPYSMRDFLLCPPRQIRLESGRPVKWTVDFGFNARNANGGYSGLTPYVVVFKKGVITLHALTSQTASKDGLDGLDSLIARAGINHILKCPGVPDGQIQALIAAPLTAPAK